MIKMKFLIFVLAAFRDNRVLSFKFHVPSRFTCYTLHDKSWTVGCTIQKTRGIPLWDADNEKDAATFNLNTKQLKPGSKKTLKTSAAVKNKKIPTSKVTKKDDDGGYNDKDQLVKEIVGQLLDKFVSMNKESFQSTFVDREESELSSNQTDVLNSIVRISCTHSQPNFGMPWQRLKQEFSSSTGFAIHGKRILTNAHAIEYGSLIQVKKRQSEKKYVASVLAGLILHSIINKCNFITNI